MIESVAKLHTCFPPPPPEDSVSCWNAERWESINLAVSLGTWRPEVAAAMSALAERCGAGLS